MKEQKVTPKALEKWARKAENLGYSVSTVSKYYRELRHIMNIAKAGVYVFPILKKGMSEEKKRKAWKQKTKMINKYLRRVQERLGIEVQNGKRLTTYTARHTLSELLFTQGVNEILISDMLGHSSTETAKQNYRSRSSVDQQRAAIENIFQGGERASDN